MGWGNFTQKFRRNFWSANEGFIDRHARDSFAIRFLFWCIDTMCFRVDCEAVDLFLNGKILELPVVVGVIHLEDGNRPTSAGDVDSLQPWMELDHIRPESHGQEGNRL